MTACRCGEPRSRIIFDEAIEAGSPESGPVARPRPRRSQAHRLRTRPWHQPAGPPPEGLVIHENMVSDVLVLRLSGRLTADTVAAIGDRLALHAPMPDVVIDMRSVTTADPMVADHLRALAVAVGAHSRRICVSAAPDHVVARLVGSAAAGPGVFEHIDAALVHLMEPMIDRMVR